MSGHVQHGEAVGAKRERSALLERMVGRGRGFGREAPARGDLVRAPRALLVEGMAVDGGARGAHEEAVAGHVVPVPVRVHDRGDG